MAASAISKVSEACWNHAKSEQLSMVVANLTDIQSTFSTYGYTKIKHHSGFGGYAKMIAAKLIPESIDRTVVVDSDTIFNAEFEQLWSQFNQFSSAQVLMGKRLADRYCLSNGNRINSGVVPMDLKHMRDIGWTDILLSESRNCHKCAGGDTLICGDQEFISFGCQQRFGACGDLDVRFHYDYCNEKGPTWGDSRDAVIYHFNCGGDVNRCPGHECKSSVAEWNRLLIQDVHSFDVHASFNQTQTREQRDHSDLVFDLTTWTWMAISK